MLTLYKPQRNSLESLFNNTFDHFWNENRTLDFSPRTDIQEEDDKYLVRMDMPGVDKENVKIEVEDGYLTVSGERKSQQDEKQDNWIRCERSYGKFSRSFKLGGNVNEEGIHADFKNGELTLSLPKAEKAQKKLISIN